MAAKKKADAAVENTAEVTQESVQEEIEQVAADNAKELDNKKYVIDHLLSTKREGDGRSDCIHGRNRIL